MGALKNEESVDAGGFMHEETFCGVQLLLFFVYVQLVRSEIYDGNGFVLRRWDFIVER